jgi:NAD kinase
MTAIAKETSPKKELAKGPSTYVRVAHNTDRRDPAILDLQRGGLHRVAMFDDDETGQAIDEAISDDARYVLRKQARAKPGPS